MKGKNGFQFFEGKWDNDKPNGYGVMKFPNSGDRHEGNYKDGRRDGLGVFLWSNGDKYSGHFKCGAMHGYGRFEWSSGDVYTGDFVEGHANGDGFMVYADGRRSSGMFQQSKEWGWIKQVWPNGDTYAEYLEDRRIEKFGCFDWMNGDRYEGQFQNGLFHGLGSYTVIKGAGVDKEVVEMRGTFKEGEMVGIGSFKSDRMDFEYFGEFDTKKYLQRKEKPADLHQKMEKVSLSVGKRESEEEVPLVWAHLEYSNGIHYDGDTREMNRHGMGQLIYTKTPLMYTEDVAPFDIDDLLTFGDLLECIQCFGSKFLGLFDEDIPHGGGELFLPDGQIFQLAFAHGIVEK